MEILSNITGLIEDQKCVFSSKAVRCAKRRSWEMRGGNPVSLLERQTGRHKYRHVHLEFRVEK